MKIAGGIDRLELAEEAARPSRPAIDLRFPLCTSRAATARWVAEHSAECVDVVAGCAIERKQAAPHSGPLPERDKSSGIA